MSRLGGFGLALALSFSAQALPTPRACVPVVKACRAAGFIAGKKNKHPGQGMWSSCVRLLAKGKAVKGVKGVSKKSAQACLQSRRVTPQGKARVKPG